MTLQVTLSPMNPSRPESIPVRNTTQPHILGTPQDGKLERCTPDDLNGRPKKLLKHALELESGASQLELTYKKLRPNPETPNPRP